MRNKREEYLFRVKLTIAGIFLLALLIGIVLGVFRIRKVEVTGNTRHSAEEIKNALIYDFQTSNTLFFCWKYRHAEPEPLTPFLNSVQAKMVSPSGVRITVEEKGLVSMVQYNGSNVYIDADGVVMEITDKTYEGVIPANGIMMEQPVLYQKLPVSNTALLRTMLSVSEMLRNTDLTIDSLSFDDNLSITAWLGNIEVLLGQDEYMEEKIANLKTIYPQIAGQTGTLNMSAFTGKSEMITYTSAASAEPGNGTAEETQAEEGGSDDGTETGQEGEEDEDDEDRKNVNGTATFMVFDSSGQLHYDAHVVNGEVVDANGNPIDGCTVDSNGNAVDAYMNVIDPNTGNVNY